MLNGVQRKIDYTQERHIDGVRVKGTVAHRALLSPSTHYLNKYRSHLTLQ